MSKLPLNLTQRRQLVADWFVRLGEEASFDFDQRSTSSQSFTFGSQSDFHVTADFSAEAPYLRFTASDEAKQTLVDKLVQLAIARVNKGETGGVVWYTATLGEASLTLPSHSIMSDLLLRWGNQVRIQGWRRLGTRVLLEFGEDKPEDWKTKPQLLAPKAIVKAHVVVPGPCAGEFSKSLARPVMELVQAVCTFALGRPLDIPHEFFPSKDASLQELEARWQDAAIANLARKSVSLDVFERLCALGGLESFTRVRAALLTFDAAVRQERVPVASILYVVASEALATPFTPWRKEKLTKRFREFFDQLMPNDLDEIIAHANFEDAFGIKRGARTARALRRDFLERIYDLRSGLVHEGLGPSYVGISAEFPYETTRRDLLSDFAETAILRFLEAPRSSVVGHPAFEQAAGA